MVANFNALLDIEIAIKQNEMREAFVKRYEFNRPLFVRECIDWEKLSKSKGVSTVLKPTDYQLEFLGMIDENQYCAIHGPHGIGKTAMSSWCTWHWMLVYEAKRIDWKFLATASNSKQLEKFYLPEVRNWYKFLRWDIIPIKKPEFDKEYLARGINLEYGAMSVISPRTGEGMEGAHGDAVGWWFDEAKAIPNDRFDAVRGAFSNMDINNPSTVGRMVAQSTPGPSHGAFYEICTGKRSDWAVKHVTSNEAINSGRMTQAFYDEALEEWGKNDMRFIQRIEGLFYDDPSSSIIPINLVQQANNYWRTIEENSQGWGDLVAIGVDVADSGEDATTIAYLYERGIKNVDRFNVDTGDYALVKLGAFLQGEILRYGKSGETLHIVIDSLGVGAGVYQSLAETVKYQKLNAKILPFRAGAKPPCIKRYPSANHDIDFLNMRSAGWWELRELLVKGQYALPPEAIISTELSSPKYETTERNRLKVESKDSLRKAQRLGRSTDYADAIIHAIMYPFIEDEHNKELWAMVI